MPRRSPRLTSPSGPVSRSKAPQKGAHKRPQPAKPNRTGRRRAPPRAADQAKRSVARAHQRPVEDRAAVIALIADIVRAFCAGRLPAAQAVNMRRSLTGAGRPRKLDPDVGAELRRETHRLHEQLVAGARQVALMEILTVLRDYWSRHVRVDPARLARVRAVVPDWCGAGRVPPFGLTAEALADGFLAPLIVPPHRGASSQRAVPPLATLRVGVLLARFEETLGLRERTAWDIVERWEKDEAVPGPWLVSAAGPRVADEPEVELHADELEGAWTWGPTRKAPRKSARRLAFYQAVIDAAGDGPNSALDPDVLRVQIEQLAEEAGALQRAEQGRRMGRG